MKREIPHTPFATRLSGSAKEIELRLRSIFQWKKKRPPVMLLLAALIVAVGCGGLVGFSASASEFVRPQIHMAVQYYNDWDGIVEIPRLSVPDGWTGDTAAIDSINEFMGQLEHEHRETVISPWTTAGTQCVFYPTETDRYLNLVFHYDYLGSSGNDGGIVTQVYDKQENRLVTAPEALELAGLSEAELLAQLESDYNRQRMSEQPPVPMVAQDTSLVGFRIRDDGQPEFYLTAFCADPTGGFDGWQHLFVWSQGEFTQYYCHPDPEGLVPLIPPEETLTLEAPLWCQWYFSGGTPEGGVTSVIAALRQENNAIEAYKAILQGNQEFEDLHSGERLDMNHLTRAVTPDEAIAADAAKVKCFTVLDLDSDGTSEMVLWLATEDNEEFAFLILHEIDGVVYSSPEFSRTLGQLKADGSFTFSSGAADWGFGTMKFEKNAWTTDEVTYCKPVGNETLKYVVNHENATRAEFLAACEKQEEKEDAAWYDLTDANIKTMNR